MAVQWPTEVERVSGFLRESGAEARVEEFSAGTPTAAAAAQAVGCKLGQIVKSLVFDCDGRWVVALVPGDRRADLDKIAAAAGAKKARIARPEEVEGPDCSPEGPAFRRAVKGYSAAASAG